MGGFLAQPANKYSALQFDIFCKYPYCLPCIVGGCMGLFSLLCELLKIKGDAWLHIKGKVAQ